MQTEYPFHTAFFFVLMTVVGIRMYYHGVADALSGTKQTTKNEGVFWYIRLFVGGPVFFATVAYIIWPPWMAWSQFPLNPQVRWLGLLSCMFSLILLKWLHTHLAGNFTGTVMIRPKGNVVTTGPYHFVRHPMYISFLLLGIGILLLTANWFLGGGFLLVILAVIVLRTSIEEAALEAAYGEEYALYKQKTGAFIPRLFSR